MMSRTMAIPAAALVAAFATLASVGVARADDACVAKLTPDGKAIYAAVVAARPTTDTLRTVVEQQARSLAMSGKIGRGTARQNATAAGECVKGGLQ